jgi:hypothetical protein
MGKEPRRERSSGATTQYDVRGTAGSSGRGVGQRRGSANSRQSQNGSSSIFFLLILLPSTFSCFLLCFSLLLLLLFLGK